jgi:hypothetical protein
LPDDKTPVIRRSSSVFPSASPPPSPWGGGDQEAIREDYQRGVNINPRTERDVKEEQAEAKKRGEDKTAAFRRRRLAREMDQWANERLFVDGRMVQQLTVVDEDGQERTVEVLGGYRQDNSAEGFTGADPEKGLAAVQMTSAQRRKQQEDRARRSSTFSILGISDLNEDARFIMNYGPRLDENGTEAYSGNQDLRVGGTNASQRPKPTVTNMMTLAGGVTWFRNLSRNDPEAYREMVDLLVGAGYMEPEDARGVYTINAGQRFALAAADAAENAAAGSKDDLRTFLQKIQGDVQALEEQAEEETKEPYKPIQRDYTDPAALNELARATAEDLLGRGLSDEELAQFTGSFRGLEDGYYDQIDEAGRTEGTARVTRPNASGRADAFVRSDEFGEDRARQLMGTYMDAFRGLFE